MLRIMIGEKELKEGRLWSSKNIILSLDWNIFKPTFHHFFSFGKSYVRKLSKQFPSIYL